MSQDSPFPQPIRASFCAAAAASAPRAHVRTPQLTHSRPPRPVHSFPHAITDSRIHDHRQPLFIHFLTGSLIHSLMHLLKGEQSQTLTSKSSRVKRCSPQKISEAEPT